MKRAPTNGHAGAMVGEPGPARDAGNVQARLRHWIRRALPVVGLLVVLELLLVLAGVDLGGVPNLLGYLLLLAGLLFSIAALPAAVGPNRGPLSVAAAAVGIVLLGVATWWLVAIGDLPSWLILWGFLIVVLSFLVVLGCALWGIVLLVRRRERSTVTLAALTALALIAVTASAVAFVAPGSPSAPSEFGDSAELDEYMRSLVADGSPPSVNAVVIRDGRTVYSEAFGSAYEPAGIPATPETANRWWSVTKVATAVAVLRLVDQGRIDIDDPVERYLPSFQVEGAGASPITVSELLNHSAGLPQNLPEVIGWMQLEGEPLPSQLALFEDRFEEYAELEREPGDLGVYSNIDYMVLGALIEQVSGQPYEEYVTDEVLRPLGMVSTDFTYTPEIRAHEGVGAHPVANPLTIFLPVLELPWPSSYIRSYDDANIWFNRFLTENTPPTGLIGPATEMARLGEMVLNEGRLDGERVLSTASAKAMLDEYRVPAGPSPERDEVNADPDEIEHGVAWFVVDDGERRYYEHTGGGPGWTALLRIYPDEGMTIALMANGTSLPVVDIADAIAATPWS
jgi:D-alanyl-D-alanine carboxypeptidase